MNSLAFAPAKFNIDFLSIIGDAIHNLSSALDSAVSQLISDRSGHINRRIYFPTHEDLEQLKASFETKQSTPCRCGAGMTERPGSNAIIRKYAPELEQLVLDVFKPCASEKSYLWQVRKADNVDKHNMLIVAVAYVTSYNLNFATEEGLVHIQNQYTLRPGERYELGISEHLISMMGTPTFETVFIFGNNSPLVNHDVLKWLWGAYSAVVNALMRIEETFGGEVIELPIN